MDIRNFPDKMKKIIEVETGQVEVGGEEIILKSNAIGSCVVIIAYDSKKKVGAIAHVMLPGRSPKQCCGERTRYAADAIDVMINKVARLGANMDDLEVCLVGGANVLKANDDTIWKDNIESVVGLLGEKGIQIATEALGGTERKSVSLNIETASISYSEAEENEKLLWKAVEKSVDGFMPRNSENQAIRELEGRSKQTFNAYSADQEHSAAPREGGIDKMKRKLATQTAAADWVRAEELENAHQASLNIMEDLERRKKELEETQKAYVNIVQDMEKRTKELEKSQTALLNMMDDLARAKKEIEEWGKTLEQRVEERTRKLREATTQLIQSEKLAAIGELVAGVAHELNQPLNGIKIICQSILRDIQKNRFEAEALGQDLDDIVKQVDKMAEIIDHMRIFTRSTDETMSKEMIDVNTIIKGPFKFLNQQLKTHNIEVMRELAPDLPKGMGDPNRLEQVFMNLITNARNAVDSSGKENKRIEIRTYTMDKTVVAEVRDNGDGIPEDLREKIFQPFFTTKEPGKGTGLGLSVSSKIIEEHKGRIELESIVGEGATFRVILPTIED